MCSGRGECDVYSRCACSRGFEGPSCALRTCPSAEAWGLLSGEHVPAESSAGFQSAPHLDAVCAGRGLCDQSTGQCACQFGFDGAACERMSCPLGSPLHDGRLLPCSGRGLCTDLARLAHEFNFWDFPRPTYTEPWDKEKIYGCLCDEGYSGYDCSLSECAVGDDPLERNRGTTVDFTRDPFQVWRDSATTTFAAPNSRDHGTASHAAPNDLSTHVVSDYSAAGDRRFKAGVDLIGVPLVNEVQLIYCQAASGWFTLRLGTRVSERIDATSSAIEVQQALEGSLGVGPLSVAFTNPAATQVCGGTKGGGGTRSARVDNVVAVEFLKLTGRAARMQAFTGGDSSVPPLELEDARSLGPEGSAYVSLAHGPKGALLGQRSVATNRGALVCSGRGVCDERGGSSGGSSCACQPGFVASDGLALGGPGGLRLQASGLPHAGEGQATKNPALRFRHDSLPSPAYGDCGALDPSVFPSAGFARDRAAGDGGGVGGGACPGTFSGSGAGVQCSGHGACSGAPAWQCACESGWDAYDCSLRACPRDRAWFDFPRANDEAHWALQECAGRGHCDRELGTCACEAGFRGAACATLDCPVGRVRATAAASSGASYASSSRFGSSSGSGGGATHPFGEALPQTAYSDFERLHGVGAPLAPSRAAAAVGFTRLRGATSARSGYESSGLAGLASGAGGLVAAAGATHGMGLGGGWRLPPPGTTCSGHGVCLSQSEHARRALDSEAETDLVYGQRVATRTRYSAHFWDADRLSGCLCDGGWTGYDCSLRTCPVGDDPNSYGQDRDSQLLRCLADPSKGTRWFVKFRRDGSALASPESVELAANATAADVQRALDGLPTVGQVEVALLNGGQLVGGHNATAACARRRAGDALLVLPEAPPLLFTDAPRELRVGLTAWPAAALTVTLTCRRSGPSGAPCDATRDLHVWPRNFTFLPHGRGSSSGRGSSNMPVTGSAPPPQAFNVTAFASGRYALTAAWGGGGDDPGAFVALANASAHAATALSGAAAQASAGAHTVLRAFQASAATPGAASSSLAQLATPDLGALNLTLLPGSREGNLSVALAASAWAALGSGGCYTARQGSGCDDDDDGDDLTNTLVVTPTATAVSSSSSSSSGSSVSVSFEPSSVTLSRASPTAQFAVKAAAGSGAGSATVAWALSGVLAANVTTTGGGLGGGSDGGAATVTVASVAWVYPPARLPPTYRSAASATLALRLASSPPAGSGNLTITPTLVGYGAASSSSSSDDDDDDDDAAVRAHGAAAVFEPPTLVFVPGGPRALGFRVVGRRAGIYNLTYALAGGAAAVYRVTPPKAAAAILGSAPGGDGGDESDANHRAAAAAVAAGWWPLTVAAAPVLRVRFLTESGALPRLRARAAQRPEGADPGAHVEVYSGGAVALGEFAATAATAAGEVPAQGTAGAGLGGGGSAAGAAVAAGRGLVSVAGTTEAAECSDRGVCDRTLGTCQCFDGYRSSDGNGAAGARGDCGFLVPDAAPLWVGQQPPNEVLAPASRL